MSKFIDAVEANLTDKRVMFDADLKPLSVSQDILEVAVDAGYIYRVGVEWTMAVGIHPQHVGAEVARAKENVVAELREIVYGEMRLMAIRAQRAAYNRDWKETTELLDAMLKEMRG